MVVTRHTPRAPSPAQNNSADSAHVTDDKAVRRIKRKLAIDAYDSLGGTVQEPAKKKQKSLGTYTYRGAVYNIDPDTPTSWIEYNAVKKEEKKRLKARHAAGGSDEESWGGAERTQSRDPTTRKQSDRADGVEMVPIRGSMPTEQPSHENPLPRAPNHRIRTSHEKRGEVGEPSSTLYTRCASTSLSLRAAGASTAPDASCSVAVGGERVSAREIKHPPDKSSAESQVLQALSRHSPPSQVAAIDRDMPEFKAINRPGPFEGAPVTARNNPAEADVPGTWLNTINVNSGGTANDSFKAVAAQEGPAGFLCRDSGIHTPGPDDSATSETIEHLHIQSTSIPQQDEQLGSSDATGSRPTSGNVARSVGNNQTVPQVEESTSQPPCIDNSKLISFLRRINRSKAAEAVAAKSVSASREFTDLTTAHEGMSSSDVQGAAGLEMTAATVVRSQVLFEYNKNPEANANSMDGNEPNTGIFRRESSRASSLINAPPSPLLTQNNVMREHPVLLRRLGHGGLLGDAGGENQEYIENAVCFSQHTRSSVPFPHARSPNAANGSTKRFTANSAVIVPADARSPRRSGRNGGDATQVSAEAHSSEGKAGRRPRQPDEERRKQKDLAIVRGWPIVRKLGIGDFASSPTDERK